MTPSERAKLVCDIAQWISLIIIAYGIRSTKIDMYKNFDKVADLLIKQCAINDRLQDAIKNSRPPI